MSVLEAQRRRRAIAVVGANRLRRPTGEVAIRLPRMIKAGSPPPKGRPDPTAAGIEARNTAVVIVDLGNEHPPRLAAPLVARATYPGAKGRDMERATDRIRTLLARGAKLAPRLGPSPLGKAAADEPWQRWALALSFRSPIRTPGELREAYRSACRWFRDKRGQQWARQHLGTQVRGHEVTLQGLLGEVAQALTNRTSLKTWPANVSKAFDGVNLTGKL